MFHIVIYILIALAVLIGVFVAIVAMQPSAFRIERSATMSAPPTAPFALVNDFHNWDGWAPWMQIDPTMKKTYEGSLSGTGAKYSWLGNKQVGEGRMTITESRPNEFIRIDLQFIQPFKANNISEFLFKADGPKTTVTWSMTGTKNFMFKAMGLFMSMDKMVGKDFEKGLAGMKEIVEAKK
ncbi:MAG TPA: SRPBCC family protein [Gemmataceae bacterium]|nr:SRPBCC family protein [Gemmataceae bacterium]